MDHAHHNMRGQLSLQLKHSYSRSSAGQNSGSPAAAGSRCHSFSLFFFSPKKTASTSRFIGRPGSQITGAPLFPTRLSVPIPTRGVGFQQNQAKQAASRSFVDLRLSYLFCSVKIILLYAVLDLMCRINKEHMEKHPCHDDTEPAGWEWPNGTVSCPWATRIGIVSSTVGVVYSQS